MEIESRLVIARNPREGGAWWAAIYGVAQSRTRLKQLSSSSSRERGGGYQLRVTAHGNGASLKGNNNVLKLIVVFVKRLFYTSVSLLLSRMQGYHYHLSKFHIYALVYCIGVFLSGLLHSV